MDMVQNLLKKVAADELQWSHMSDMMACYFTGKSNGCSTDYSGL